MISLPRWKRQQWVGILLVLMLVLVSTTSFFRQFTSFPAELRLFSGNREAASLNHPRHGNGRCGRSRYPCGQRSESTVRSRRSAPSIHPFFQKEGSYPAHPPPVRNPSAEDVKCPRFARHPRHSRRPIDRGETPVPGSSGGGPSSGSGQRGRQIAG